MQKVWRRRGWHMNQDGSHSPVEVPGPASFDKEFWDREADDCIGWLSSGARSGGAGADGNRGLKKVRQQLESVRGALRNMKVQLKGTASDGSWKVGLRPMSWA